MCCWSTSATASGSPAGRTIPTCSAVWSASTTCSASPGGSAGARRPAPRRRRDGHPVPVAACPELGRVLVGLHRPVRAVAVHGAVPGAVDRFGARPPLGGADGVLVLLDR